MERRRGSDVKDEGMEMNSNGRKGYGRGKDGRERGRRGGGSEAEDEEMRK